jgi:hypothetical protein
VAARGGGGGPPPPPPPSPRYGSGVFMSDWISLWVSARL